MPLITEKIGNQNFELIRDRIALILADEITNQSTISPVSPELNAKVFTERFVPFSHVDMPCVNVVFARGVMQDQYTQQNLAVHQYFIDIYSSAKTDGLVGGDEIASKKLHRLCGIVLAILENPQFRTLGFQPPSIQHTKVVDIAVEQPQNTQDATSLIMGRVTFDVHVPEKVSLLNANNIAGWETNVQMGESLSGYQFSKVVI